MFQLNTYAISLYLSSCELLLIIFFLLAARFKIKYHPEESVKRKDEQVSALKVAMMLKFALAFVILPSTYSTRMTISNILFLFQRRVEVFLGMLELGEIDKVSVDADQADALLRLLDAVVIKLEGGTEEDLQVLDVKPPRPMIAKDILKEKEDKNKSVAEKKTENRCFKILETHKILKEKIYIYLYAH